MDREIEKKTWTKKKIISIALSVLFGLFVLYIFVFADRSSKLNIEKEKLTISEVRKAPFQEYIPVTGTVEPIQTFYLDLSDGGKVIQKFVEEGMMVNPGDAIIKLDNPNLSLQVMSTQSSFLQAESVSKQTKLTFEQNLLSRQSQLLDLNLSLLAQQRDYKNNKVLYEKKMISKNEFENCEEKYETLVKSKYLLMEALKKDSSTFKQLMQQSESNVDMSKKYLSLIQNQLANLMVKAPIKGQLTSLKAEIGQNVGVGYRLGQIDNIDSFKVRADIDEHYITKVRVGQIAEYELDGKTYTLKIKTVYPQVSNGVFNVDMIFIGGLPKGIRRGQSVHIKLELSDSSEALLVESGGFYSTTGGQWIFVVDKSGKTAVRRKIKIGRQNPQFYEVLEGLNSGESVITSSYDNFNEIDKLILK